MLVDRDAGRVLLRDRGEAVGFELRMRERFGRLGLGWVELLLDEEGAVVETVGGRGDGRGGRRGPRARGGRAEPLGRPRADRVGRPGRRPHGRRLLDEVRAGFELERVSLRAPQARMLERIEAGETLVTMCERAGFVDRDGRIDLAGARPRPDRCSRSGKVRRARTASYEVFLRLVRAVDGTPEEFGV